MKQKTMRSSPNTGTSVSGPHKFHSTHSALEPLFKGDIDYLVRTIRIREVRAIEIMLSQLGLAVSAWYPLALLRAQDGMSQREQIGRASCRERVCQYV